MSQDISVGIVADWLVTYAGAERVIKEFIELYPSSELYALVEYLSDEDRIFFQGKKATTSFVQNLPFAKKKYQKYLPFMPFAVEQLDVTKHNVVISSSHAVAKGVLTGPDQLHISYVHSPIRYAWDMQFQYLKESGLDKGIKCHSASPVKKLMNTNQKPSQHRTGATSIYSIRKLSLRS